MFWSPPFEGPLRVSSQDVLPYYEAYRKFDAIVEGGKHTVEFKLKQGDLVMFNQRRSVIAHVYLSLDWP